MAGLFVLILLVRGPDHFFTMLLKALELFL